MLLIILLVAALILTLLALADLPRGAAMRWLCVSVLLVIIVEFLTRYNK